MGLHRLDADPKQLGNRVIGIAFRNELDDLPFARREPPVFAIAVLALSLGTGRSQISIGLVLGDHGERLHQPFLAVTLAQIAYGAGFHRLFD